MDSAHTRPASAFTSGHYECQQTGKHLTAGDRVRFLRHDPETGTVQIARLDHTYTLSDRDFRAHYVYLPDGEARYAAELTQATLHLTAAAAELSDLERTLADTQVTLGQGGTVEGMQALLTAQPTEPEPAAPPADSQTLSPATTGLQRARSAALGVQLRVKATRELAEAQRKHIERLTAEALAMTRALMAPIEAHIKKLEETVWTLELYAGSRETIVALRTGTPAPATEPLTVRQTVLSMAEESAVMLDDLGMDNNDIDLFDAWLTAKPERLDLFLPEPKGVVAFVSRWDGKDYGNPFRNAEERNANLITHFLIRNGENLYRVSTAFQSGPTLIPTHAEFMALFEEDTWEGGVRVRRPLTPGSRAYLDAEQRASDRQRHYYRVALILQGLIDRTAVFQPLPLDESGEARVSLTTEGDYAAGRVRVIEDTGMALADGRETFAEWRSRVNEDMEVGRRVIGNFGRFSHGPFRDTGDRYGSDRFWPQHANRPAQDEAICIEARNGRYFVARYDRTDEVIKRDRWGSFDGYGPAERRASVKLLPGDAGVLLIDHPDVTPALMRDFLGRRAERHHYLDLVPMLKAAVRFKEAEAAEEAPFRALLLELGQSLYGYAPEDAGREADAAIHTFKYARRHHRALPVEDTAAFQACADLMKRQAEERANRAARRTSGEFEKVTAQLRAEHRDALLIIHRRGNEYAVAVPHRAHEHVYAAVHEYRTNRGALRLAETREWATLSAHWTRAEILHRSERAGQWTFNPSTTHTATDPEWADALAALPSRLADLRDPIVAAVRCDSPASVDVFTLESGECVRRHRLSVRREDGRATLSAARARHERVSWSADARPWDGDRSEFPGRGWTVLELDEQAAGALDAQARAEAAKRAQERDEERAAGVAMNHLRAGWRCVQEEAHRQAFLARYGAQSAYLWADHKKTLTERDYPMHGDLYMTRRCGTFEALCALHGAGVPLAGMTVADVTARAQALGADVPDAPQEIAGLALPA